MNDRQLLQQHGHHLTPKQREALELAAKGYGYKRISRILGISPQAAAQRIENAHRRLQPYLRKDAA